MKRTAVDRTTGDVVCPVCGARNQFVEKRTGKAKVVGVATVGVGVLAMPKRLKCNGCGANLKRGGLEARLRAQGKTAEMSDRAKITVGALVFAVVVVALVSQSAHAAVLHRRATPAERRAIAAVVYRELGLVTPDARACVPVRAVISTVDPRFARAYLLFSDTAACLRYAANGDDVLRRRPGRRGWRVVWSGSVTPGCAQLPPPVTLDLFRAHCG